ncbi:MAG: hypothetical protein DDT42_00605 [candidate division WS2 bacterium]|uniref:Lipoprotein n=1 Tax=Psychracetigena formicireducens TaxID=2986056 RepID=A0A9E2BH17_PSYF1|nr:hypothetical protein [Candidatus Psychracetigena formicireducens]MBT9144757.1 hypothetical protein [Candidatus Psychracetigena formicireducens]
MKNIIILFLISILFISGCRKEEERMVHKINSVPYYLYYFNDKIFAIAESKSDDLTWTVIEILNDGFVELVTLQTPPQFPILIEDNLFIFGDNLRINLNNRQVFKLTSSEGVPSIVLVENGTLVAQFSQIIWFFQEDTSKEISIPAGFNLINLNREEMIFFDNKQTLYFTDREFNINREMGTLLNHQDKSQIITMNPREGFAVSSQGLTNLYYNVANQLTSISINDGIKEILPINEGVVLIGKKVYIFDLQGNYQPVYTPGNQYRYYGKSFDGESLKILFTNSLLNKSSVLTVSNNHKISIKHYREKFFSIAHNPDTVFFGSETEIIQINNRIIN